jgi:hypothetical protein
MRGRVYDGRHDDDAPHLQVGQAAAPGKSPPGEDIAQKLAALRQRRATVATDLATLADSGDGQISRTDPDARLLAKHGQIVAGYNVQIAVDDKHKLIPGFARTASEVVNEGNDTGQLAAMAEAAKAAVGAEALSVVADAGYYNGATLKACEDAAITAYVPPPDSPSAAESAGPVQRGGLPLRHRGRCLSLSGRRRVAADARAEAPGERQDGHSLRHSSLGLPEMSAARTLSGWQARAARDRTADG